MSRPESSIPLNSCHAAANRDHRTCSPCGLPIVITSSLKALSRFKADYEVGERWGMLEATNGLYTEAWPLWEMFVHLVFFSTSTDVAFGHPPKQAAAGFVYRAQRVNLWRVAAVHSFTFLMQVKLVELTHLQMMKPLNLNHTVVTLSDQKNRNSELNCISYCTTVTIDLSYTTIQTSCLVAVQQHVLSTHVFVLNYQISLF